MTMHDQQLIILVPMIGLLLVTTAIIKIICERLRIPAVIGYLCMGIALRYSDLSWNFLTPQVTELLGVFAQLGIITLLFRAGLESDLKGLVKQLRRASVVWCTDVLLSGLLGFAAAYFLLHLAVIPSLVIGTALTATSVGVSLATWQEAKAATSENGELLLDIAELDDISAVLLMALLFTLLPLIHSGQITDLLSGTAGIGFLFILKLGAFVGLCYLFASFAEHPLVHFLRDLDPPPLPMLTVMGIGLLIAGLAGFLGFSTAIGAFFAGLVFSKDAEAVKMEASFMPLYQFFTPFFFIGIGLDFDPASLQGAAAMGFILFAMAALSKIIANMVPIWIMKDLPSGLLIGVSMMPRAEISMVIMQKGQTLGDWAVPAQAFGAMVLVTMLSCWLSPLLVKLLLRRWPQNVDPSYVNNQ